MDAPDLALSRATEAVEGAEPVGELRLGDMVRSLAQAALRSSGHVPRAASLGREAARVAVGRSEVAPEKGDWRFRDPAWQEHPAYRRAMQLYLAWSQSVESMVEAADLEWRDSERARFFAAILTTAVAPTNTLLGNPAAIKRAFETGGASVVRGARNLVRDVRHNGGMPLQVDSRAFTLGENLAATPGGVVYRDEVCEVIQYTPSTPEIRSRPVLVIPPQINKYYFMDLAPKRSFVEHAVSRGLAVLHDQLAQPRPRGGRVGHGHLRRCGAPRARRRARGQSERRRQRPALLRGRDPDGDRPQPPRRAVRREHQHRQLRRHAAGLRRRRTPIGLFDTSPLISHRDACARRVRACSTATAWRTSSPGCARTTSSGTTGSTTTCSATIPPTFDILAWNADPTNLPARAAQPVPRHLHREPHRRAEAIEVLGTPVDLGRVEMETYVTGATDRSPHAVEGVLPDDAADQRAEHLHPQQRRAHREPRQPAGQPEGPLLRRARSPVPTPTPGARRRHGNRDLVGALGRLGRRALRRRAQGTRAGWAIVATRSSSPRRAPTSAASSRSPDE